MFQVNTSHVPDAENSMMIQKLDIIRLKNDSSIFLFNYVSAKYISGCNK